MLKMLPIVKIGEKHYFMDERLEEFRNVDDVDDRIDFRTYVLALMAKRIIDEHYPEE